MPKGNLPEIQKAVRFYDKYEPQEELGNGMSSIVRRCVNKVTMGHFAVKMIDLTGSHFEASFSEQKSTSIETNQKIIDYIENEVDILKQVSGKPNIIKLVEHFRSTAYYFIVFELMEKGELFQYLTSNKSSLCENETKNFMSQIFNGLSYLHSNRIIHRDIKLENLLLDSNNRIKITDFGFATTLEKDEVLRDLVGTINYMSPEMLRVNMNPRCNPGYSFPIDVWACGVIMFTLVSGKQPFYHRKEMQVLRKILECSYSYGVDNNEISDEAKDLITCCLNIDQHARFTIDNCLEHSWFENSAKYDTDENNNEIVKKPAKRIKFRSLGRAVIATLRLRNMCHTSKPCRLMEMTRKMPYEVRRVRMNIDKCAFGLYRHWLQGSYEIDQSHAVMFENQTRFSRFLESRG